MSNKTWCDITQTVYLINKDITQSETGFAHEQSHPFNSGEQDLTDLLTKSTPKCRGSS